MSRGSDGNCAIGKWKRPLFKRIQSKCKSTTCTKSGARHGESNFLLEGIYKVYKTLESCYGYKGSCIIIIISCELDLALLICISHVRESRWKKIFLSNRLPTSYNCIRLSPTPPHRNHLGWWCWTKNGRKAKRNFCFDFVCFSSIDCFSSPRHRKVFKPKAKEKEIKLLERVVCAASTIIIQSKTYCKDAPSRVVNNGTWESFRCYFCWRTVRLRRKFGALS